MSRPHCLWHEPRVGVLLPRAPSQDTVARCLPQRLDQLRTVLPDPELVYVREHFQATHPLDAYCRQHWLARSVLYGCEPIQNPYGHLDRAYAEVLDYVTHLLLFYDGQDPRLYRWFIHQVPIQPVKIVMVQPTQESYAFAHHWRKRHGRS